MKKNYSLLKTFFFLLGIATFYFACDNIEDIPPELLNEHHIIAVDTAAVMEYDQCKDSVVANLELPNGTKIGEITVANDEDFLYVTLSTISPYMLDSTRLYIGDLSTIPSDLSYFPNKFKHDPSLSSFTYKFDLSSCSDCFVISAAVDVIDTDLEQGDEGFGDILTGQIAGTGIKDNGLVCFFTYCKRTCECEIYEKEFTLKGRNPNSSDPNDIISFGTVIMTNDETDLIFTYNITHPDYFAGQLQIYTGPMTNADADPNDNDSLDNNEFDYDVDQGNLKTDTVKVPYSGLIKGDCIPIILRIHVWKLYDDDSRHACEVIYTCEDDNILLIPEEINDAGWYYEYCIQGCFEYLQ